MAVLVIVIVVSMLVTLQCLHCYRRQQERDNNCQGQGFVIDPLCHCIPTVAGMFCSFNNVTISEQR